MLKMKNLIQEKGTMMCGHRSVILGYEHVHESERFYETRGLRRRREHHDASKFTFGSGAPRPHHLQYVYGSGGPHNLICYVFRTGQLSSHSWRYKRYGTRTRVRIKETT